MLNSMLLGRLYACRIANNIEATVIRLIVSLLIRWVDGRSAKQTYSITSSALNKYVRREFGPGVAV